VNLATGVAYVTDGRARVGRQARAQAAGADGRRAQTGCGRGRRERWRHGAWLTAGGQATIERSEIVACKYYYFSPDADYVVNEITLKVRSHRNVLRCGSMRRHAVLRGIRCERTLSPFLANVNVVRYVCYML